MPTRIEREDTEIPISIQKFCKNEANSLNQNIFYRIKFGANVQTFAQIEQFLEVILMGIPQIVVV
jgi:hypothetical protein